MYAIVGAGLLAIHERKIIEAIEIAGMSGEIVVVKSMADIPLEQLEKFKIESNEFDLPKLKDFELTQKPPTPICVAFDKNYSARRDRRKQDRKNKKGGRK